MKVSLNGLRDAARLPCAETRAGGGRDPGNEVPTGCSPFGPTHLFGPDFSKTVVGLVRSNQSAGSAEP